MDTPRATSRRSLLEASSAVRPKEGRTKDIFGAVGWHHTPNGVLRRNEEAHRQKQNGNMKSHDFHIFFQFILPVCLRHLLDSGPGRP